MYRTTLALVLLGALMLTPSPALAADPCCHGKACCEHTAACCEDHANKAAADVILPRIDAPLPSIERQSEPVRQVAVVTFQKPVWVGEFVLLGKYIIEHDNQRMANGLPCTHIYAANKPQVPVVKFHCTHLERARAEHDIVVLSSTGDTMVPSKLTAFQFAGETAGHGVPRGR
jgi:hypothetical protein